MEESKYLKLARQARKENNTEDAKRFYDMLRTEDPENIEAKYFYAYFNLNDAINRDVPNKFVDYCKAAVSCIKYLKDAEMGEKEKMDLLEIIVTTHVNEAISTFNYVQSKRDRSNSNYVDPNGIYDMSQVNMVQLSSIHSLEDMGNNVETLFGGHSRTAMSLAAECWKGIFAVRIFSQWYYFQSGSSREESAKKWKELVDKIQSVDSSFATPQTPKAVQCGNK